jgi:hypothetical protein
MYPMHYHSKISKQQNGLTKSWTLRSQTEVNAASILRTLQKCFSEGLFLKEDFSKRRFKKIESWGFLTYNSRNKIFFQQIILKKLIIRHLSNGHHWKRGQGSRLGLVGSLIKEAEG